VESVQQPINSWDFAVEPDIHAYMHKVAHRLRGGRRVSLAHFTWITNAWKIIFKCATKAKRKGNREGSSCMAPSILPNNFPPIFHISHPVSYLLSSQRIEACLNGLLISEIVYSLFQLVYP